MSVNLLTDSRAQTDIQDKRIFNFSQKTKYLFKLGILVKICGLFSIDFGVLCLIYRYILVFFFSHSPKIRRLDFAQCHQCCSKFMMKTNIKNDGVLARPNDYMYVCVCMLCCYSLSFSLSPSLSLSTGKRI